MGRPLALVEALEALDNTIVMLSKKIKEYDPVDASKLVKNKLMPLVESRLYFFPDPAPDDYRCDFTRGDTVEDTQAYAKPCVSVPAKYDEDQGE